jgi:integrase/recombinase XerD
LNGKEGDTTLPAKLTTTITNVEKKVRNQVNRQLIQEFFDYLTITIDTSENYQNGLLKVLIRYAEYLGPEVSFYQIQEKQQVLKFLDSKRKMEKEDPDKKWITTWNDYLWRIKYFFRWLYNAKEKGLDAESYDSGVTPSFINIKMKLTKRLSPYMETEIWDRDDLFTIIRYEPHKRNKAIIALLWDLDARPHEVTLLKIKHIQLKEKYGEGEIPHEAKTGSGPALLTFSFPYVRDWLNEHPFKNSPDAALICSLLTGRPIRPDQINEIMKQLRKRITRLVESTKISKQGEIDRLQHLLKTKKWNPYCIRHSAITADSDHLPDYALKKKARWSMNSKQGARYIKRRMGNELKAKILEYNGISVKPLKKQKPTVLNCSRCELVNALENKYCSKCSYPLTSEAYDQIKQSEEHRFKEMENKYAEKIENLTQSLTHSFENKIQQILLKVNVETLHDSE